MPAENLDHREVVAEDGRAEQGMMIVPNIR
jgi:hypothetical protein